MPSLSRSVYDSLLPSGSFWKVKQGGDFDKLLEGMGDNTEDLINNIGCLACLRDPLTTPILSDLEKEYGIATDTRLTEEERRQALAAKVYRGNSNGSKDDLKNALQMAGFNVQVHENSPAVDPAIFIDGIPFMVCGGLNAYCGYYPVTPGQYTSIAGRSGGYLLVNGAVYEQSPNFQSVAGAGFMACGNQKAISGYYEDLRQDLIQYEVSTNPAAWPFYFFVGGDATRNPATGELTNIEIAIVDIARREEFERIILQIKPLHSWAGLIVEYR
jgi:hypothetical protein